MRQILSLTVLFQQFVHLANVREVLSCIKSNSTNSVIYLAPPPAPQYKSFPVV